MQHGSALLHDKVWHRGQLAEIIKITESRDIVVMGVEGLPITTRECFLEFEAHGEEVAPS